jgi:hypothetical protein
VGRTRTSLNNQPKKETKQMKTKQKTLEKRAQGLERLVAGKGDAQADKAMNKIIKDKLAAKGISREWMKSHLVII